MITIDGSRGEGGGQVLRTSLGLAALTGTPTRVENIRAGRAKPGLMRQHLASVRAAAAICDGALEGDAIGSRTIALRPGALRPGAHSFDIGSAGSASLVLQTVLPALLRAKGTSVVTVHGGTHNPLAPPFEFLERCFQPQLARIGHRVSFTLEAHGFVPAGGGRLRMRVDEPAALSALTLLARGEIRERTVRALVSQIPGSVAQREIDTLLGELRWLPGTADARPEVVRTSRGPGNALIVSLTSDALTEVISTFGARGQRAEAVATEAAELVGRYVAAPAPVGEHLADQLILPMALGAGGCFRTLPPSEHLRTQIELVRELLGARIALREDGDGTFVVEIDAV